MSDDVRRLIHKTPCRECPWRRESVAGFLGGFSAEHYADIVQENQAPSCHLRDHGPGDPETAFCVGALHVAANACIGLREPPHAEEAKRKIGRNEACFSHPREFFSHHTHGGDYTPRMLRVMSPKAETPRRVQYNRIGSIVLRPGSDVGMSFEQAFGTDLDADLLARFIEEDEGLQWCCTVSDNDCNELEAQMFETREALLAFLKNASIKVERC